MNAQDFIDAHKAGKSVIFTDIDGKKYEHKIVKAGKIQANLVNGFNRQYKLNFRVHKSYPQYSLA